MFQHDQQVIIMMHISSHFNFIIGFFFCSFFIKILTSVLECVEVSLTCINYIKLIFNRAYLKQTHGICRF